MGKYIGEKIMYTAFNCAIQCVKERGKLESYPGLHSPMSWVVMI